MRELISAYFIPIVAIWGVFYIFVLWVLWMIVKCLRGLDTSLDGVNAILKELTETLKTKG